MNSPKNLKPLPSYNPKVPAGYAPNAATPTKQAPSAPNAEQRNLNSIDLRFW